MGIGMNVSIKKQKEMLDHKMKEFTREKSRFSELKLELEKKQLEEDYRNGKFS